MKFGKRQAAWVGAVIIVGALSTAFAQEEARSKLQHKPVKQIAIENQAPVTEAEARATFEHAIKGFAALVSDANLAQVSIPSSGKPVSREEVIREMNRIYELARPSFKYTPRPTWFDSSTFTIKAGTPEREALEKMVRQGVIAVASPVATARVDTLNISDFGDTVGIFAARMADLTHMPDPKYSPTISGDGPNYTGPLKPVKSPGGG